MGGDSILPDRAHPPGGTIKNTSRLEAIWVSPGPGKVVRQRSEIGVVGAIRRRGGSCTAVAASLAGMHTLGGDRSILLEATLLGPCRRRPC